MAPRAPDTPDRAAAVAAGQQLLAAFSRRYTASFDTVTLPTEAELLTLLDAGPALDVRSSNGFTALHYAARLGYAQFVQQLIIRGAPLDAQNNAGITPLHLAAQNGHHDTIRLLIDAGAPTDICENTLGQTPLHFYAANFGNQHSEELSKLFCKSVGFNPDITDHQGNTALDLICRESSSIFAWTLARNGARIAFDTVYHSDLGERYIKARTRWQDFITDPKVTLLNHEDLYLFANYGMLESTLADPAWREHPKHFRELFHSLPFYLQSRAIEYHPRIAEMLSNSPDQRVTHCNHTPPGAAQQMRAS